MSKPPPGMSMMEEMKWKQAQKAKEKDGGGGGGDKPAEKPPPPPGLPPSKKAEAGASPKPPPGMSMMEEMKWKQAQKNGTAPPEPPASKKDEAPSPPKPQGGGGSGSLAAKQKMLEGMFAAQGKGPAPKPKSETPPAKKWGTVDTSGEAKPDLAGAANALAAKLGGGAAKSGGSDEVCPDLSKYEKMAKMLPQGAVENAMNRDGVDPGWMFGADCITCKSDKRPPNKGAAPPAAAAPAAPSPAPVPVSRPTQAPPSNAPPPQASPMPPPAPSMFPQNPAASGSFQSLRTQMPPQQQQHYQQSPPQAYAAPSYGAAPPPQPGYGGYPPQAYGGPPQGYGVAPPAQWTQVWSTEYNQVYYTNLVTGESTWTQPPGFVPPPVASAPMPAQQRPIVQMLYNFQGTGANPGELQVMANDQIEVYEVGADGWSTGRCLRTNQTGLYPTN